MILNVTMMLIMNFCQLEKDFTAWPIIIGDCLFEKDKRLMYSKVLKEGDLELIASCIKYYQNSKSKLNTKPVITP